MTFDSSLLKQHPGTNWVVKYDDGSKGIAMWHGKGDAPIVSEDEDGLVWNHDREGYHCDHVGRPNPRRDIKTYKEEPAEFSGMVRVRPDATPYGSFIHDGAPQNELRGDNWHRCTLVIHGPVKQGEAA